ncbi:MAG: hypothetical protein R6V54_08725 [Desulfobacteraceae bacterium]
MKIPPWKAPGRIFAAVALSLLMLFSAAGAKAGTEKIVVAPFQINSPNDIDYISNGVQTMLLSRLAWKDRIIASKLQPPADGSLREAAAHSGADYLLLGSITEFAGALSIDTKVYDLAENRLMRFYTQVEEPEAVIPGTALLAGKINRAVFSRTTPAPEKQTARKQETSAITANPEKMMQEQFKKRQKKEKPFWKIW